MAGATNALLYVSSLHRINSLAEYAVAIGVLQKVRRWTPTEPLPHGQGLARGHGVDPRAFTTHTRTHTVHTPAHTPVRRRSVPTPYLPSRDAPLSPHSAGGWTASRRRRTAGVNVFLSAPVDMPIQRTASAAGDVAARLRTYALLAPESMTGRQIGISRRLRHLTQGAQDCRQLRRGRSDATDSVKCNAGSICVAHGQSALSAVRDGPQ